WEIGDWLAGKLAEIHKEFDREAHAYFMGAVSMMHEVSLSYLDKEFEKLALYTAEKRIGRAELAAVFSGLPEVSSFAMLDAVSEKDVKKALTLLRRQTADGVYAPVLLALMVRHVRQLWQAKLLLAQGVRGKALGPSMKLNSFIAEKLGRASMKFSEPVLKRAMLSLIDADYLLKTGRGGVELLEDAVISLCR
ncbi:MAG: DNA polymerase III subunit delta, partial [Selenomonas sp.]